MSVTFNNTNLETSFIVSNVRRPLPEFRSTATKVDGADGEAFDLLTLGPRECMFDVYAIDKSQTGLQDAARILTALFSVKEPKVLQFSDEKDPAANQLKRYAVPTGSFDETAFIRAGMWECRFISYDPFLYGISKTANLAANTDTEVQFGTTVDGRMKAPALITAITTPSATSYTLTAGTKYVKFDVPDGFSGSTLTLDFKSQTASLSPARTNATGLSFGSSFFPLSGTVTLNATAATALSWTERWL